MARYRPIDPTNLERIRELIGGFVDRSLRNKYAQLQAEQQAWEQQGASQVLNQFAQALQGRQVSATEIPSYERTPTVPGPRTIQQQQSRRTITQPAPIGQLTPLTEAGKQQTVTATVPPNAEDVFRAYVTGTAGAARYGAPGQAAQQQMTQGVTAWHLLHPPEKPEKPTLKYRYTNRWRKGPEGYIEFERQLYDPLTQQVYGTDWEKRMEPTALFAAADTERRQTKKELETVMRNISPQVQQWETAYNRDYNKIRSDEFKKSMKPNDPEGNRETAQERFGITPEDLIDDIYNLIYGKNIQLSTTEQLRAFGGSPFMLQPSKEAQIRKGYDIREHKNVLQNYFGIPTDELPDILTPDDIDRVSGWAAGHGINIKIRGPVGTTGSFQMGGTTGEAKIESGKSADDLGFEPE